MTRSDRPERLAPGSGHLLRVVVDGWASPPPVPVSLPEREYSGITGWHREWQMDALLSAMVVRPQPICLITGI